MTDHLEPNLKPTEEDDEFDSMLRRTLNEYSIPTGLPQRLKDRLRIASLQGRDLSADGVPSNTEAAESLTTRARPLRSVWARRIAVGLAASLVFALFSIPFLDRSLDSDQLSRICFQELDGQTTQTDWKNDQPPHFWKLLQRDLNLPDYQLVGYHAGQKCTVWKLSAPFRKDVFVLDFPEDYALRHTSESLRPLLPMGSWSLAAALYQDRLVVVAMLGEDIGPSLRTNPPA